MPANNPPQKEPPITFPNGNQAGMVRVSPQANAADVFGALGIPMAPAVIVLCGSTIPLKPKLKNRISELLSRGAAKAALETHAAIITGGTQAGVIELMGQGVSDRGYKTPLIGVSPSGKVTYPNMPAPETVQGGAPLDPNHSHFVLVESDQWGGETDVIFRLAQAAVEPGKPVLTILAGGNPNGVALEEALETVQQGWPLVVLQGTGRLADLIARLVKRRNAHKRRTTGFWNLLKRIPGFGGVADIKIADPRLSEIIRSGTIFLFPRTGDADRLRGLLKNKLTPAPKENVLYSAWMRFAEYDLNSMRHRNNWFKLKNIPLILGALSTLLVLLYSAINVEIITEGQNILWIQAYTGFMNWLGVIQRIPALDLAFRFLIILLPISTSIFLGLETRFKLGSKYFLLRGAAESVKRGIYSYRILHKVRVRACRLPKSEKELSSHLASVSKFLLESDVKEAAFRPYQGSIPPEMYGAAAQDDGISVLDPETYIRIRIGDQLSFYSLRTNQYERQLRRLLIWILVLGGLGTFLAAIGAQYWLPFTSSIVAGMTAFLEYRQIEQILVKYNQTKASLDAINSWWQALLPDEKKKDENIYDLVREVEATLESENQGWVTYINQAQGVKKAKED